MSCGWDYDHCARAYGPAVVCDYGDTVEVEAPLLKTDLQPDAIEAVGNSSVHKGMASYVDG